MNDAIAYLYNVDVVYECIKGILVTWAPVIAAVAGISLAIGAYITIRHSNRQYRLLKEEKLINKVIEWATDCAEYAIKLNEGRVVDKEGNRPMYLYDSNFAAPFVSNQVNKDTVEMIQKLRARSTYIKNLVPRKASDLNTNVDKLTNSIRTKLEYIYDPEGRDKWEKQTLDQAEKAWALNINIYESAVKVSGEASKYIGTL